MGAMRFSNGDQVEVSWDDEGFQGAWYEAKVARTMSRTRRYSVVYDHLLADDVDGETQEPRPLREIAEYARVRPRPPRRGGPFAPHQPVEAWHNDGWWTGVVVAAPAGGSRGGRYTVCFPIPREQMEFAAGDLRAHLEWVDDVWVHPDENSPGSEALAFLVGAQVEVVCRTGGSLSMWFVGTVEKLIWENNLLVQYESLQVDSGGEFLREIVNVQHVRPCPPDFSGIRQICILDEVEVFHDDGWCTGVVTKIHSGSRYSVSSEHWVGEREFHQSKLRLRQEWIDGCWVQPSKATHIKSPKLHQKRSARHSQGSHIRNGAFKSHGSDYVPISSDSQDTGTDSNTEMENELILDQISISLSCKNPKEMNTVEDETLFLGSLINARAAKSAVHAEKEFATPTIRERRRSRIIDPFTVQLPCHKKPLAGNFIDQLIEESSVDVCVLATDLGENDFLVGDKLEHQPIEQSYYSSFVNHEIKEVHHHLKWAHKRARRPRMNFLPQKRKVVTCPPKHRWNIYHNAEEIGPHIKEKGRCRGGPSKAKVLITEISLDGESLGDPRDNIQLADKESEETLQGSLHLLQLNAAVEADPSSGDLAAQELLDMTVSTCTGLNENSGEMQLIEPAREKQSEAFNVALGGCESHGVVNVEAEVTTDVIPCCSSSRLYVPFVKSSSMWEGIEAMDVFRTLPQQPHFRPLLKYCSELREGMAIGLMVTFDRLVSTITKLQINDPESVFEERLNMLSHLEDHGFDVQSMRDCLEKLLRIKHDREQHEEKKTTLHGLILKRQNVGQKFTEEIEVIDRSVKELEEAMVNLHDKRSALVMQRETNGDEIAKLQIDEGAAIQASLSAVNEFNSTLSAAW